MTETRYLHFDTKINCSHIHLTELKWTHTDKKLMMEMKLYSAKYILEQNCTLAWSSDKHTMIYFAIIVLAYLYNDKSQE